MLDEAQKIHEDGVIFVKNRKFDAQRSLRATSLETRCGAHPSSFRTSAIQTIFKVPSPICVIMRIISENDDRTTRFACEAVHREHNEEMPIVSMAPEAQPSRISWQHKRSKWYILHYARMCRPQYFAQRTPTCNCAAYHANVLIRRPLVA